MKCREVSVVLGVLFGLVVSACSDGDTERHLIRGEPDLVDEQRGDLVGDDLTDAESDAPLQPECQSALVAGVEGFLVLSEPDACHLAVVQLRPVVLVEGEWLGGFATEGDCVLNGEELTCPAGSLGSVVALSRDGLLQVRFEAGDEEVVVNGLGLEGLIRLPGASGWLSNGFQSWSQSGVIAIGAEPTPTALAEALAASGDIEVLRGGEAMSWWTTVIGGQEAPYAMVAGVTTAGRFKSWLQVFESDQQGSLVLRAINGGVDEAISLAPSSSLDSELWFLQVGDELEALLEHYASRIPSRRAERPVVADIGWNSWYDLWDGVDEAAVRENAALARLILEPLLPDASTALRIVVDDGWQVAWGEWQPNQKFPSGLDGLAADLHAQGFEVGVWLAPLLVEAGSSLAVNNPDWFVGGAHYLHTKNGRMLILDVTRPAVAEHLTEVISTLVDWGYDLLKIDFLFAGTFPGQRYEELTGMEAYARALEIIRAAAGEDTILLGVGSPGIPSLPYVDTWRMGPDIALEPFGPHWAFMLNEGRSLAYRWHMCRATLCDADPVLLRALPRAEVEVGGWLVALAGGSLFLSDDLRRVPEERYEWGLDEFRTRLSLGGEVSVPLDYFPATPPRFLRSPISDYLSGGSEQVVPMVWRLPTGERLAINTSEELLVIDSLEIPVGSAALLP